MSKKVIEQGTATTLLEMLDVLEDMALLLGIESETAYVTINSDSVRLKLIEEPLTDGSTVFNIELSEVCAEVK